MQVGLIPDLFFFNRSYAKIAPIVLLIFGAALVQLGCYSKPTLLEDV